MTIGELQRLYRTVEHLKLSQVCWRVQYLLERRSRVTVPSSASLALSDSMVDVPVLHRPRPHGDELVASLARGEATFLHHAQGMFRRDATGWRLGPQTAQRLPAIHLHYMTWLYELGGVAIARGGDGGRVGDWFRALTRDWLETCALQRPGARDLAWNSFAIATRLTWWIRLLRLPGVTQVLPLKLFDAMLASMVVQARYLGEHIEWDLRGNHLLRDAVGLAWAGRFFSGAEADAWLARATDLALDQVAEQVLADGGHFERSPMYHLQVMEDVFQLALLLKNDDARAAMRGTWRSMADVAAWMRHPDGQVPLFNDGGFNGACAPHEMLTDGAGDLGLYIDASPRRGGRHFRDFGMVVWHGEPWSVFFDAGPLGPDYQPGHGHADTLALECSYKGVRLFVDPGSFGYDHDACRAYDRSTASHNTVCVDGTDSSEVWHIFRVGRRARVLEAIAEFKADGFSAEADHDGYAHLPGRPRHFRRVTVEGESLTVVDRIEGHGAHLIEGGWLLAPEWSVETRTGIWTVRDGARAVVIEVEGPSGLDLRVDEATYHPEYGLEHATKRLAWRWRGALPARVETRVRPAR